MFGFAVTPPFVGPRVDEPLFFLCPLISFLFLRLFRRRVFRGLGIFHREDVVHLGRDLWPCGNASLLSFNVRRRGQLKGLANVRLERGFDCVN